MAVDSRFKDVGDEIVADLPESPSGFCAHPTSTEVGRIILPGGVEEQVYLLCQKCNSQWQEIVKAGQEINV